MEVEQIRNCIEAVSEYEGGSQASWYRVRGHVDKARFKKALRSEFGVNVELDDVRHEHWRNIPDGRKGIWYCVPTKPGRGAYPVTVVDAP